MKSIFITSRCPRIVRFRLLKCFKAVTQGVPIRSVRMPAQHKHYQTDLWQRSLLAGFGKLSRQTRFHWGIAWPWSLLQGDQTQLLEARDKTCFFRQIKVKLSGRNCARITKSSYLIWTLAWRRLRGWASWWKLLTSRTATQKQDQGGIEPF